MTDEEFGLLQTCIDAISERISELHYGLAVEYDFNKLTDFLLSTGSPIINSTFDPRVKPVPEDAFWLRVLDDEGRTVATHAERLFMTGDFIELIESGDLWHHVGTPKPVDQPEPEIHRPETHLSGKIAYGGSMWVDKAHRGKGLSLYLPYLSRALFMRNYETDFHAGLVLNTLGMSSVPRKGYGFAHVDPVLTGWFTPAGRPSHVYLCWMSQEEALAQFRRLPQHPAHPIPLRRPQADAATG